MRVRSLLSEAGRNLATGTTRAVLLACVFVALIGVLAAVDVRAVVQVVDDAAEYRAAGASVQVLESVDRVDARRCEDLSGTTGITSSGAIRASRESLYALNLPASELAVHEVTPGLLSVVAPGHSSEGAGIWLSDDLAATLGAHVGNLIATTSGSVTVAGVFTMPDDGRERTLAYSVLAPVPPVGNFDECWAEVWPTEEATTALVRHSLVAGSGDGPEQERVIRRQLNSRFGAQFDAKRLLDERQTRFAPVAALMVGVGLGAFGVWVRRLEFAAALHARVQKPTLMWQVLLESAVWLACAVAVCAAALVGLAAWDNPDSIVEPWLIGLRVVSLGAVGAAVGAVCAVGSIRERHLFRYFKER